jgi:very-short-patch-repair endonuclease
MHRPRSLPDAATTIKHAIPCTTPQRTFADLRRNEPADVLRDAIRAAEVCGIDVGDYADLTRNTFSELEHRFLALCRRHRLARPEVNARVGRYRVDFLWREQRLIVETDGNRYHRGALAAAEDARRQHELEALGFTVIRFTWRDVVEEPKRVAAEVRARLRESPA